MTTALPTTTPDEALAFFVFDGDILDSWHNAVPEQSLKDTFGTVDGKILADELKAYHPLQGRKLKLEIQPVSTNPALKCLKATAMSNDWSRRASEMFGQMEWVPSPSGYKFLVPRVLDPKIHKLGNWTLHYAKLQGGPNPYAPEKPVAGMQASDPRARKVILTWTLPGLNEYVYTCWAWG